MFDPKQFVAEVVERQFKAEWEWERRHRVVVRMHSEDATSVIGEGFGAGVREARINAISQAFLAMGWAGLERVNAAEEVKTAACNLPPSYGQAHLDEAALYLRKNWGSDYVKILRDIAATHLRLYWQCRFDYLNRHTL